jgi:hypothetical protein
MADIGSTEKGEGKVVIPPWLTDAERAKESNESSAVALKQSLMNAASARSNTPTQPVNERVPGTSPVVNEAKLGKLPPNVLATPETDARHIGPQSISADRYQKMRETVNPESD